MVLTIKTVFLILCRGWLENICLWVFKIQIFDRKKICHIFFTDRIIIHPGIENNHFKLSKRIFLLQNLASTNTEDEWGDYCSLISSYHQYDCFSIHFLFGETQNLANLVSWKIHVSKLGVCL
jgi:hypothetical protein